MTPFDQGSGRSAPELHRRADRTDRGESSYVRCATQPDYVLPLQYRVRANVNPTFPRTGNLWGWWQLADKGLPYMARIDLWLGADPSHEQVLELRRLNPDILILTSINAVENGGLPDDYYLKDVNGQKIEVWPGSYRLNLTRAPPPNIRRGTLINGCWTAGCYDRCLRQCVHVPVLANP
jgi:hypothetical protein